MARILVIDDEPDIRLLIRGQLEEAGHSVDEAPSGKEGLTHVFQNDYAVVVCDIMMPVKDGIETIMELRRHHPNIRVVAISGGGSKQFIDVLPMARKLGADRILPKPFDPEDLVETVGDLLQSDA